MVRTTGLVTAAHSARPPVRLADAWVIGFWAGLVTGCLEACLTYGTRFVPEISPYLKAGSEVLWLAPLAYAVVFSLLALPLVVLARMFRHMSAELIPLGTLSALGLYTVLTYPRMVATFGVISLSLGGAVMLCRSVRGREEAFHVFLRRYLLPTMLAVALITGGAQAWLAVRERLAIHNLPTPANDAPNVLLLVIDAMRGDRLSLSGYARQTTPRLDAFASESVHYVNAYSTASWTLPSHTTFLTGRYTYEHLADYPVPILNHGFPYLPQVLAQYGYRSALFSANTRPVTQEYMDAGFHYYDTYTVESTLTRMSFFRKIVWQIENHFGIHYPRSKRAPRITGPFLEWVDRAPGRPFFVLLNYIDVHDHYIWEWGTPPPFDTRFGDARRLRSSKGPPRTKERIDLYYDSALAYADDQIGHLLEELRRRGLDKNTLVIITSDHGESLEQHGLHTHATSLYYEQLHVPLLIRLPGKVPAGVRVTQPVSLVELPSTVMHLLNLPPRFPGAPLPLEDQPFSDGDTFEEPLLAEYSNVEEGPHLKSLLNSRWHYIVDYRTGAEKLFDLRADREELHDLSQSAASAAVLVEFRKRMKTIFPQIASPPGAAKAPGSAD